MSGPQLFSFHWQRQSQLDSNSAQSLLIALMRGVAALEVAAAHLRAEMYPGLSEQAHAPVHYLLLAFATGFAHQAVVVFFLISGWLVGGSLLNKFGKPAALASYAIDRTTRLWTVLVPALCLTLAIGSIIGAVDSTQADFSPTNEFSAASFFGNLVGLQTILVQPFAHNYSLWSLSNEFWYYLQFPLLLIVFFGNSLRRRTAALAVLVILVAALPLPMTLYFGLWLLGAAFSRVRIECKPAIRRALLATAAACLVYFRLRGVQDDLIPATFLPDILLSLPLLAFLSSMHAPLDQNSLWLRRPARVVHMLSEFSFTLYVVHVPMIKLLRYLGMQEFGRDRLSPSAPLEYTIYLGMLLSLLLVAYLSYLLFESHTFRVRRAVKATLQPERQRPVIVSASAE